MTITILLVVVALLALLFVIRSAKGQISDGRLESPAASLQSLDIEAFRNLMDPREEEFLRRRLPPGEFRKLQRERLRAALGYIFGAAHNARILLRLSEAASYSSDPATVAAAAKLRDNATRLRLYSLQAAGRLYLALLFPATAAYPARVADSYEQITRQVVMLGLQFPSRGVSAAL